MAWSTARKNRARDNAAVLGYLQNRVIVWAESSPIAPVLGVIAFFVILGLAGGLEHSF
jgi:hypothetical protein